MKKSGLCLSVILPTYDEAGNIIPLIHSISQNLRGIKFEIIVMDDDSPDNTASLVKKTFKKTKSVKVIIRKTDHGLANSIREGITKAKGKYILVMDTDFNHDPADIPALLKIKGEKSIIVGSRYIRGGGMQNKSRYVLSLFYNYAVRLVLRLPTTDNLSGFFIAGRKKLSELDLDFIFRGYGDYFLRLLYLANKQKLTLKEIPVFYKNRTHGLSKSKFIPMFLDYTKTVWELLNFK